MANMQKLLTFGRVYLFPSFCPLCGRFLVNMQESHEGLCLSCKQSLIRSPGPYCQHCGRPLVSETDLCMVCRNKDRPAYDGIVALFPYVRHYGTLIKAYKFGMQRDLARYFAVLIQQLVQDLSEQYGPVDAITPVPPQKGKKRKKGWDQMDHIAQILKKDFNLSIQKSLIRLKSKNQKELNRTERQKNLEGKIRCIRKPAKTIILFDDVITTGTTLNTCAAVLKQAGARLVYAIALFYD